MSGAGQRAETGAAVEAYLYTPLPVPTGGSEWELPRVDAEGNLIDVAPSRGSASSAGESAARPDHDLRQAEEARRSFEAGRERGRQEGRDAERAAQAPSQLQAQQHRADQLDRLLEDFAEGRASYLRAVEQEVVRLTRDVAARILRREAQMDTLFLLGAVRVALGQLAAATEVRLYIPAADVELWKDAVALIPNARVKPTVHPDAALRLGDCRLETGLGSVDLALDSQLTGIEQSFFEHGPAARIPALAEPIP